MPYASKAQAAYMHIHHPEVAKEFDSAQKKAGGFKKLPYKKKSVAQRLKGKKF